MSFYEKFLCLCEERGIRPTPAALEAGITKSAVVRWKNDPDLLPSTRTLAKLCSYFNVPMSYFTGVEEGGTVFPEVSEEDERLIRLVLSAPDKVKQSILTLLTQRS